MTARPWVICCNLLRPPSTALHLRSSSAVYWYFISWFRQWLSRLFFSYSNWQASLTSDGKLCHAFMIFLQKEYLLLFWLTRHLNSLKLWPNMHKNSLYFLRLGVDFGILLNRKYVVGSCRFQSYRVWVCCMLIWEGQEVVVYFHMRGLSYLVAFMWLFGTLQWYISYGRIQDPYRAAWNTLFKWR